MQPGRGKLAFGHTRLRGGLKSSFRSGREGLLI